MDDDHEDDWEPSFELLRLVEQEDKEIEAYQEIIEILNLGDEDEKKEAKIGNNMSKEVQGKLCDLVKDFRDVFASSYQDMPGLDTDIM